MLRKRIQELQHYRRMGLTTSADIDKFEMDSVRRVRIQPTPCGLLCINFLFTDTIKDKYVPRLLRFRANKPITRRNWS